MISAALYDRAREAIAASGFDSDTQTRIALFVGTVKSLNAALLAAAELLPATSPAYRTNGTSPRTARTADTQPNSTYGLYMM